MKTELKEKGYDGMWMKSAQDCVQWQALVISSITSLGSTTRGSVDQLYF